MGEQESPLLSMAPGFYYEKPVLPVLRRHFSAVWFHRKPLGVTAHSAVVPDACAELVWCRGNLLIAGPDRQVSLEPVPPGTTAVGMRFLPGAVAALLRVPASEIVGARLQLDCFWSGKAQELIGAIGDAQEPYIVPKRLETALAGTGGRFRFTGPIFQDNPQMRRPAPRPGAPGHARTDVGSGPQ
jgi:hypothetical protein